MRNESAKPICFRLFSCLFRLLLCCIKRQIQFTGICNTLQTTKIWHAYKSLKINSKYKNVSTEASLCSSYLHANKSDFLRLHYMHKCPQKIIRCYEIIKVFGHLSLSYGKTFWTFVGNAKSLQITERMIFIYFIRRLTKVAAKMSKTDISSGFGRHKTD